MRRGGRLSICGNVEKTDGPGTTESRARDGTEGTEGTRIKARGRGNDQKEAYWHAECRTSHVGEWYRISLQASIGYDHFYVPAREAETTCNCLLCKPCCQQLQSLGLSKDQEYQIWCAEENRSRAVKITGVEHCIIPEQIATQVSPLCCSPPNMLEH